MSEPDIKPEEVLERYKQLPKKLESAVAGLAEPVLDLARAPDAWSIRQIVHHIVDADDATKAIVKAALGTNGCLYSLEWYDPHNTWAVTLDYRRRPTSPALSLLRANHRELEELLRHLPDAWDRHVMLRATRTMKPCGSAWRVCCGTRRDTRFTTSGRLNRPAGCIRSDGGRAPASPLP